MGVGGPWRVSINELMDKNLPYFVGGNLAALSMSEVDLVTDGVSRHSNAIGHVRLFGSSLTFKPPELRP